MPPSVAWSIGLAAILVAVALLVGFLTPVAGGTISIGGVAMILSLLPSLPSDLSAAKVLALNLIALGLTAALLGPGAFSLDAHLFGRREIIIPEPTCSSKDLSG